MATKNVVLSEEAQSGISSAITTALSAHVPEARPHLAMAVVQMTSNISVVDGQVRAVIILRTTDGGAQ